MASLLTTRAWPSPVAPGPIDAVVAVPGSKSLTNRHLLLAALASGTTLVRGPLDSRDSRLMIGALRELGVLVTPAVTDGAADPAGDDLLVTPAELTGPATIDCGLAGTVMRFVPALAALASGDITFDGDERARQRPMGPVIAALRALGVRVSDEGRGALPFTVHGTGTVTGGRIEVAAAASSQFVSAFLLPAARFENGVEIALADGTMPSHPHVAMTVETLRALGVKVDVLTGAGGVPHTWRVAPGPIDGGTIDIEPDLSNAGPFLAAALVTGGGVTIPGWPEATTQAGGRLREILPQLGATAELTGDGLRVSGTGRIQGVDLDLGDVGELTPTIAALCALAETPSRLRGVAHLRGHETDRLAALVTEISRLGGIARETEDGLEIEPARLHGAEVETYHDHRMATFAAIIGLRVPEVRIRDVETTAKTLPDFTAMWQAMVDSAAVPEPGPHADAVGDDSRLAARSASAGTDQDVSASEAERD